MLPSSMGTDGPHLPEKRARVRDHLNDLIAQGILRRGSRVPSILELARSLGVAKNTVIAALDDLCGEGVLEARPRQGFFVRAARPRDRARPTRLSDLKPEALQVDVDRVAHGMASILVDSGDGLIPIGSGTAAESLLATPAWSAALKNAPPRAPLESLRYADPMGEAHLREAIAARHSGASGTADRTVITHGAIEALHLAFEVTAAQTGSRRIAIESPGYFMLAPMVESHGFSVVPIPRLPEGIDFDRFGRELKKGSIAAVMVNPNHQNPVATTLSLAQRFELAKLAEEKRFWIIEDDVYKGLWTDNEEPPTIHSFVPDRTLYVSSFSKTLGPALRIGFILAPQALVAAVRHRKFLHTLSGDSYTQNLVADFVDQRGYQRHLVEVREELARRARMAQVQAQPFSKLGRFRGTFSGGLFQPFELAPGIDVMRLYHAARDANVLLSPGSFFCCDPCEPQGSTWMRVNLSRCEGDLFPRVLRLLQRAAFAS